MALHVEINRTDDRGREFLQRIEDTFPTDGEFVFRIAESEFALAVSSNVYDYYRLHRFFCGMGWLQTNYGGTSLSRKGWIDLYRGLLPWTELDCWVFHTAPTRRGWYKGAIRSAQNRYDIGTSVSVPIRFKHRYQLLSDKTFNRYDCYALDDYTPTQGVRHATWFDQFIYRFKQGHPLLDRLEPVRLIEHALMREETLVPKLPGAILAVIPASNREDNRSRFESFCKLLCEATGMENGFDAIEIEYPRSSMIGIRHQSKISNLHIHYDRFRGRDVILFDDVYNLGVGFQQLADALSGYHNDIAASVTGVFLGRRIEPDLP